MTCNELITLCQLYRSNDIESIACGTTPNDLKRLESHGLLTSEDGIWNITDAGVEKVRAILVLMTPSYPQTAKFVERKTLEEVEQDLRNRAIAQAQWKTSLARDIDVRESR